MSHRLVSMTYIKDNDKHNLVSILLCIKTLPKWFNRLHVSNLTGIPYTEVVRLTKLYNIQYKQRQYIL